MYCTDASQQHSHDCISEYTAQAVTSEDSFQKPQLQAEDLLEDDQRHPEEDEVNKRFCPNIETRRFVRFGFLGVEGSVHV